MPNRSGGIVDPNQSGTDLALTDLDRELMKQCRQESFYRRSLPFSAALCLVTFWRHQQGHYQRYIALRYIGTAIVGNILGRVSYLGACRQKFLDAEEGQSAVKAMLMKRQQPSSEFDPPGGRGQQQQQWQQQQQKRDISLDNQPMDLSTPPPPQPPSIRHQQQQQQRQPKQEVAVKPDYGYGSVEDRYQRPSHSSNQDDSESFKPSRVSDEDFYSRRRDS